uniref:Ion transport domain-containing protein n=1 Tax=Ciona savignyi TaxID=51511 RepID=H2YHZ4_CIOSA
MSRKNCLCTDHVDIETGLFALAYILFLLKILGFETNNQYFGPILVSMGRMLKDIAKFTGVLLWVIFAYSVAFTKIFSCCTTMDGTLHRKPCNVTCFKSIIFSFATFTDTIFSQEVNINSLIVNLSPTSHSFAKYLLLSFRVVVILVMWNMLIAIMTKSYERTSENEELEWKFHRTQLWIHYIHREV